MTRKITKEIQYVRLSEKRIREIEDLVASWPYETRAFMRARLNQYKPPSDLVNALLDRVLSLFMAAPQKSFNVLKDPNILTDWQKRFEISGQTNPQDAWNKILEKELLAAVDRRKGKFRTLLLTVLDRMLIGKRTKDAKSLFAAKTKYIRKAGIVLVALLVLNTVQFRGLRVGRQS